MPTMSDMTDRIAKLSEKQRYMLLLKEMEKKLELAQQRDQEPIAVVGIGCRFPHTVRGPEEFFQLLHNGVDAISEVPPDRWNIDEYYDPSLSLPDTMNTRWGGFVKEIDTFDCQFFGISRAEAKNMDPQQRLSMEVAYEALENAAISRESLAGTQTGIFVGVSSFDYALLSDQVPPRGTTGLATCIVANRLSYFFDVHGASVGVDTACSSSLVATDMACQNLRSGSADLALVLGVNVILAPKITVSFAQAGMMAPDGRCKTFDAAANGYVRSEGCAVVVLKRLGDAIRDRHEIYGLIRGTAVNHCGRSNGLTAPNGLAQQALIRRAIKNANVTPEKIGYVETHGTGTNLGDVVEIDALKNVFAGPRPADFPCRIGSVKTNIGHAEAAAGIAGLIKGLLTLKHEEIFPHLHLKKINPALQMEGSHLQVVTEAIPWPRTASVRLVGVSSFGVGGTNAHVVLEEAPLVTPAKRERERPRHLFCLSAIRQGDLKILAESYRTWLERFPAEALPDICYTANAGRSALEYRLALPVRSLAELQAALRQYGMGESVAGLKSGFCPKGQDVPSVGFLFASPEHFPLAEVLDLAETQPLFREFLESYAHALDMPGLPPLFTIITDPLERERHWSRPVVRLSSYFCLELALARLWQSWGIRPLAVGGEGIGFYAAACLAGAFALEDIARVIQAIEPCQALPQPQGKQAFLELLRDLPQPPLKLPLISLGSPNLIQASAAQETELLWAHAILGRHAGPDISAFAAAGCSDILEIGPSEAFLAWRAEDSAQPAFRWHASLGAGQAWETLTESLADLFVAGSHVQWDGFDKKYDRRRLALPTYPFEKKRCWLDANLIRPVFGPLKKREGC
jgi:acyl transferase domain-containing protein